MQVPHLYIVLSKGLFSWQQSIPDLHKLLIKIDEGKDRGYIHLRL